MKINKTKILKIILLFTLILFISVMINLIFPNKKLIDKIEEIEEQEEQEKEEIKNSIYGELEKGNYSFKATIDINETSENINVNIEKDTVNVTIDNNTIIKNIKDFDEIKSYFKYINFDNIKTMIDLSLIKEKEEDKIIYEIETYDLLDLYNPKIKYDSFKEPPVDEITVTFEDKYIKTIEMNLNNYYKMINENNKNLIIKIEYNY